MRIARGQARFEPHRLVSPTSKLSALPVVLAMQEAVSGKPSFSMLDVGPGMGKVGLAAGSTWHGLARLEAVRRRAGT